jgi:hypothetical protein
MELIRELLANAAATYQLKQPYYWLTTCIGFAAVTLAIAVLLLVVRSLSLRNDFLAAILFIAGLPFVLYLAGVVVAGTLGLFMVC